MIQFYDVTEAQVNNKDFEAESLYFCSDSGKIFHDSKVEQKRVQIGSEITILGTESARNDLLAPIPEKLYAVIETGKLYIYNSGSWVSLGGSTQIHFKNILLEVNDAKTAATLTISDNRIKATDTAEFVPDLSVVDLASAVTATCSIGKVVISATAKYDIPGEVIINN